MADATFVRRKVLGDVSPGMLLPPESFQLFIGVSVSANIRYNSRRFSDVKKHDSAIIGGRANSRLCFFGSIGTSNVLRGFLRGCGPSDGRMTG
jgi:hypothetical protein